METAVVQVVNQGYGVAETVDQLEREVKRLERTGRQTLLNDEREAFLLQVLAPARPGQPLPRGGGDAESARGALVDRRGQVGVPFVGPDHVHEAQEGARTQQPAQLGERGGMV